MSVSNFIPQYWSSKIMRMLGKALVYGACVNRDYEGEIANAGDTVRINSVGPVSVGNYTKNSTTVTPEELVDAQSTLVIDQCKYFAFKVDDVDQAQANANVLGEGMQNAAYAMRDAADQYVASLWSQATSISGSTAVNSVNVLAALLALGQALDELNVPTEGRWCVIPPWVKTKLVLAKVIISEGSGDAFTNGFIGRAAGFDLRESNNVVIANSTNYKIMAGTTKAISFADQVNKVEAYRPESSFSDAVKGLHLYGAKVVYPDALAVLDATVAAEP